PNHVVAATNELAAEIAANAPLAVQATKRMMRLGLEETFEANVHHVFLQLLPLFQTQDFREGVRATLASSPGIAEHAVVNGVRLKNGRAVDSGPLGRYNN